MRIVVDIQGIQNRSRDRGIGRYVLSLARSIAENAGEHDVFFLYNAAFGDDPVDLAARLGSAVSTQQLLRFHPVGAPMEPHDDLRAVLRLSEALYSELISHVAPDALIVGTFVEGWDDHTITVPPSAYDQHLTAGILYDLIPLLDRDKYLGFRPAYDWYFRRLGHLANADLLLSISESARQEGLRFLHRSADAIVNISTAASEEFVDAVARNRGDGRQTTERFGIKRPFLMHTSAFDERKNFQGLVRAFAALPSSVRREHQLVLVCKIDDPGRASMEGLSRSLGLAGDEVILTGFVDDDELRDLYSAAKLFVFPSFHEGFGLPPLEAMCCGTPAIGSNVSSVPEVIGLEEAMFDPHSTESITAALKRALTDRNHYDRLVKHAEKQAKVFSWERTARTAIEAIEHALPARSTRHDAAARGQPARFAEKLAYISRIHALSPREERELAIAYTRNQSEGRRVAAMASQGKGLTWRIEGPFDSTYSLAIVNRETARSLTELGHTVVLHSTEGPGDIPVNPEFLQANPDIAGMHQREQLHPPASCDVVSRNLFPPRVHDMTARVNGLHAYAWEETGLPSEWVRNFNKHLQFLSVTSQHVRKVLIDNGVKVPIAVTGNGVDHWERVVPSEDFNVPGKTFRFLHVSSCFPRKGVDTLLEAYGRAFGSHDDVSLIIKTFENPHNRIREMLAEHRHSNPNYPDVVLIMDDLPDSDLKALYSGCDVMVSPTKAEGYSLPLAEAMLSGIPVIATAWSGQMDFCNASNAWLVDFDFEKTDTHFELWSSAWARAKATALKKAMQAAHQSTRAERDQMAEAGRAQLLAAHKWTDATARLVQARRRLERSQNDEEVRVGWVSTWNTKCGIATYSEHLAAHLPAQVTVLANQEFDRVSADGDNVVRCWKISKQFGRLCDIAAEAVARNLSAVVIQFNYSFFNHEEIAELLRDLHSRGIITLVMLHSTDDPVKELPGNELWRIADALALADRLLVHSIPDLNRLKRIGLVENVALFPHGVLLAPPLEHVGEARKTEEVIATYGFALPNKGLREMLHAVAQLRKRGRAVRLKLVNAEYPIPLSRELVSELKKEAADLGIGKHVEFHTDFLPDDRSLALLRSADLIVFAYQDTKESASGAVRYGLSAGRPVAVTPLGIFDDLGNATFRFSGTSIEALADGLDQFLNEIRSGSSTVQAVEQRAASWREQHDYVWLGQRLAWMIEALVQSMAARNCEEGEV